MAYENVFKRYEKKYLVSALTKKRLLAEMNKYMQPDEYPRSVISNIYYDNDENTLIRRSLDKPVFKEKFRLRSYCVPKDDTTVFLEIKRKYKGVVYKRRVGLTYKSAESFMHNDTLPDTSRLDFAGKQILKEIEYFKAMYDPKPFAFVGYERVSLAGKDGLELRITFDDNIRTRNTDLRLSDGDYGQFLLDPGMCLMEIKAYGAYPMWLTRALSENKLYPVSFSKIGEYYTGCSEIYKGDNAPCLQVY